MLRRAAQRLARAARHGAPRRGAAKDAAAKETKPAATEAAQQQPAVDPGNPMAPYMFPWERSVLAHGGEAGKIDSWTKAYWAVFVTAMIGYVAYDLSTTAAGRPKNKGKTEEELEWEQNEIKRIEEERVRQALAGEAKLGVGDEDVFEGMEPHDIELWMSHERTKRGRGTLLEVDPYEGLSPEEINALQAADQR